MLAMMHPEFHPFADAMLLDTMLRRPAFTCSPSNEPIIREREDAYTLTIAAPGIKREDMKLTIEDGTLLKVTGESDGSYVNYSLRLPKNADGDSVQANTCDGLLFVTVSKRQAPDKITVPIVEADETESDEDGEHPGVTCDRSGMDPIRGIRYHLQGHNFDICQAEYDKLNNVEKKLFTAIPPPATKYSLSVNAAGIAKEDLVILIEDGALKVCGLTKRTGRKISQSWRLPRDANAEGVTATHTDGMLELTIPKQRVREPKVIDINQADDDEDPSAKEDVVMV